MTRQGRIRRIKQYDLGRAIVSLLYPSVPGKNPPLLTELIGLLITLTCTAGQSFTKPASVSSSSSPWLCWEGHNPLNQLMMNTRVFVTFLPVGQRSSVTFPDPFLYFPTPFSRLHTFLQRSHFRVCTFIPENNPGTSTQCINIQLQISYISNKKRRKKIPMVLAIRINEITFYAITTVRVIHYGPFSGTHSGLHYRKLVPHLLVVFASGLLSNAISRSDDSW